jgi:hypothetical protein
MNAQDIIDLLIKLFRANAYVEDNQLFIKSILKYDIHNLLNEIAPLELYKIYDELEYDPDDKK